MDARKRGEAILKVLNHSQEPITGGALSSQFDVSRQIIVSDIALLRAQGHQIISTAKGYIRYSVKEETFKRVYCVEHPLEKVDEELFIVVDNGGHMLNTIVTHSAYGEIMVDMHIQTRRQAEVFISKTKEDEFVPLMSLTHGAHYHTVEAESEDILDAIEEELEAKGYLIKTTN